MLSWLGLKLVLRSIWCISGVECVSFRGSGREMSNFLDGLFSETASFQAFWHAFEPPASYADGGGNAFASGTVRHMDGGGTRSFQTGKAKNPFPGKNPIL